MRRRRGRLKRPGIVLTGLIATMVIVGLAFGLPSAIDASLGGGVIGSFTVQQEVCAHGRGVGLCKWEGAFRPRDGSVARELDYGGLLPGGDGPGSVIPVRYSGGTDVYARHGSHTWLPDLLITLVISGAVGFILWVSPFGSDGKKPKGVRASA